MKDKHCPFFIAAIMTHPDNDSEYVSYCITQRCQWWTSTYTTEGIEVFDCAMVIGARSNSQGKIPV